MKARKNHAVLLLLCTLLFWAGCSSFNDKTPVYAISLHREVKAEDYAPDSYLYIPVTDEFGKNKHLVSIFPVLDASCFGDVELVEGENSRYGLRLHLDRKGRGLWRQHTGEHPADKLIVLIDGFVAGEMYLPRYEDTEYIIIPPIWSEYDARKIAEQVRKNYEKKSE